MIEKALPESKAQLEKVSAEVATALDKIKTREDRWNNQLDHMTREYRTLRETLAQVSGRSHRPGQRR
jgi:chaperonin cofactor prefoldin